jgi:heme exporter protein CcmD
MFDYGRYTPYILTAYGIAGAVIGGLILWSIWRLNEARRKLDAVESSAAPEKEARS